MSSYDTLGAYISSVGGDSAEYMDANIQSSALIDNGSIVNTNSQGVQYSKPKDIMRQVATPSVTVLTMHASKGLEFDEVILPFWFNGNVPKSDCAEERRLAYVALTRARHRFQFSLCTC